MFYVRERRLWFWLKDEGQGGATVLMAMSTARRTFDYEKEFEKTRDTVAATLKGRPVVQAPLSGPTAQDTSPGSQDSTR